MAWDRFVEAIPAAGFMQSSWWADFRTHAGYEHFGIALKEHGAFVGGAIVMKYRFSPKECFYYMPEGPVLPGDESIDGAVFGRLLEAIDERRATEQQTVSHLRMEPRWPLLPGFVSGFREVPPFGDAYMEPRNTLCIDLRCTEAALLAQMKAKGRYNIRVAQRHGVSVTEDTSDAGLADFLRIYADMAARQRIRRKPSDYFRTLVTLLSARGQGSLYFAGHRGVRLAAALVVFFGERATYFYGGSRDARRETMAPYLLHFEIMREARARGCSWYDLWGVAPENEPDHPWGAISVFKRKFGGIDVSLVPTLDLVYHSSSYARYLAQGGVGRVRGVASAPAVRAWRGPRRSSLR